LIYIPNPSFNATCTSKRRSFGAALLVLRSLSLLLLLLPSLLLLP
jgi:hypothetical protein